MGRTRTSSAILYQGGGMRTWKQGLWRATQHFVIFAVITTAPAGFLEYLGVSYPGNLAWLILIGAVASFIVIFKELVELVDRKQTTGKAIIDFLMAEAGFAFGVISASWWYK